MSAGGDQWVMERMKALGIREEDLEESFTRSGGHGGQNVNKVSTCVVLTHKPTGLAVRCQDSRYQGVNRANARRMLIEKLQQARDRAAAEQRARIEQNRRRSRKPSRAAKQRMLEQKTRRAARKTFRRRPAEE